MISAAATRTLGRRVLPRAAAARACTAYSQSPEEHRMVHEMCAKFVDEELAPNAGEWDQKHSYPTDAIAQLVRC